MTSDHPTDRARDLQLDALLSEAAGVLPAPDLADRIFSAMQDRARAGAFSNRRQAWLAAAIVMLALTVVGGIAWLQRGGDKQVAVAPVQDPTAQDPKPAPKKPKLIHTLIADYSDNRVVEVDDTGKVTLILEDIFGAWDAEALPNGNFLITEFSVSRVQEIDRQGKMVWAYENLKNPYDADLLPNGNVLICNTFGSSVLEVGRGKEDNGKIVWKYDDNIRPFDADRLANGNTLIADVMADRVIEVDKKGKIVWQVKGLPNIHDADRLPNGNTLVTLRNKGRVIELDKAGETVWEITGLSSPSDADRVPNGNTLVAENTRVREFNKDGKVVWKKETSWAVEVQRYVR